MHRVHSDTARRLNDLNLILGVGEMAIETDTLVVKIGNGATPYALLAATGTLGVVAEIPTAATTVTGAPAFGAQPAVGTSLAYARADHVHGNPAAPTHASGDLALSGGTMSGPIAMGANKITGLADGSDAKDAVAHDQLPS